MADMALDIGALRRCYASGELTPAALIESLSARLEAADTHRIWIERLPRARLLDYARGLEGRDPAALPLYGVPFAIKDNIDLAGAPTTAACPAFAYTPQKSATVVQRLIDAGAIPLGKTNLDQFATGLVGVRSPHGACRNSFDPDFVSGGSSSGSAVAVALGLASFSLGTDTAGSGRVPAAFNNLIGHKPTCGLLSTTGVIPACRSLDAVSIFALTAEDAQRVLAVAAGFDSVDPFSRPAQPYGFDFGSAPSFSFAVPAEKDLAFFGNADSKRLFGEAAQRLVALGGNAVEIDFRPFVEAARLLYGGPWVAERYAAIRPFFDAHPEALLPVLREIIGGGKQQSAADAYVGLYRLRELQREAARVWERIDCLLTPTAGTIYRIREVEADPIRLNTNLGYYTNFVNLLDLSATAVPAGFQTNGLPFGVTLIAPAHRDVPLLRLASGLHRTSVQSLGATGLPIPPVQALDMEPASSGLVRVAVCGAHMAGLPLNHQLTARGARLVASTRTASIYRFYALPGGPPMRPGLIRRKPGAAIEVEVWELPASQFGSFVAGIPGPLGIGTIQLQDGSRVQGFLCEAYAVDGATDITDLGSWRTYLKAAAG